ncbi:MAG TPA: TetR/AcrR family transcriptional regulator [Gemmatimonadaceae bacterium]|nr:TetR/AcrR family transcriptional regulator [Gemmatimonadaceae bacterium]
MTAAIEALCHDPEKTSSGYASTYLLTGPGGPILGVMTNDVREKIITAAMTAYAESGFQGATTRRVAEIAGVNEVTIFRNFGSKAALMDEALFRRVAALKIVDPPLPLVPVEPLEELTSWCSQFLRQMRGSRDLLRKAMGATETRFHEMMNSFEPARCADREVQAYVRALVRDGWVGAEILADPDSDELITAAQTMLTGALWGDAMARELTDVVDLWVPETRAARRYVQVFLRALGVTEPVAAGSAGTSAPTTQTTSHT